MAEQADFYVKNNLTDDIVVTHTPAQGSIVTKTITNGNDEQFYLGGTGDTLEVKVPGEGVDIKEHPFKVKSDVDLTASHSRTNSNWTINIEPNELPPDVPTTVNVEVGVEEEPT